jgi:hypothetical protein
MPKTIAILAAGAAGGSLFIAKTMVEGPAR